MNPYITQQMAHRIEGILNPYLRGGEDCATALERLLRERELAMFDQGKREFSNTDAKACRRMLFAAVMSQPESKLRIQELALKVLNGANHGFEITQAEDMASRETILHVFRRRGDSSYRTLWDVD